MRILKILSTLDPETGGPASVFSAAVLSIADRGADVECLTLQPPFKNIASFPDYERMVKRGIKVHALRSHLHALLFLLRSIGTFDIVHVDGCWQSLCIAALSIARLTGRATVVTPHESLTKEEFRRTKSRVRLAIKRLLRLYYRAMADCIIYSSALELGDSLSHPNAVIIRHPVFDDGHASTAIEPREGFSTSGQIQVGYLGRFHFKKKVENIVDAAMRTANIGLLVAGTGPKEYEATLRAMSKSVERVKWLGFVQKDQREEFFRRIDFLVLASEYECFGMSAAEALVRGIPVIVSERVGIANDVREMQGGLVVEGDVESLSSAFSTCAGLDLARYETFQKNALVAAQLYSFSAHAIAQMGVYASLRPRLQ